MLKSDKKKIFLVLIGIIALILTVGGISYASLYLKIESDQGNIIKSGCLKVNLTDNGSVSLTNEAPKSDEDGLKLQAYEYTLTNTCSLDAYYESTLNVLDSATNASKVRVSLAGDSYLAPISVTSLTSATLLGTSSSNIVSTYLLDSGYVRVGETKTYQLRMWISEDVTSFTGTFNAKVAVNSYMNEGTEYGVNTAGYQVLEDNAISPASADASGLQKGEGKEYYFKGNVTNNYVDFANNTWRIIKINQDGSLKIILDKSIGTSAYATTKTSKENVLYNNSNIKTLLDTWYTNTLKGYGSYVSETTKYCSDSKETTEGSITKYGSYIRNITNKTPSNNCDPTNTVEKVGLITADEVAFAGGENNTSNTDFYLYNKNINGYWTMSPSSFDTTAKVFAAGSSTKSLYEEEVTTSLAVRPVITLRSGIDLAGNGTKENPYRIGSTASDTTAPVIKYAYTTNEYSKTDKNIYIGAQDENSGSGIGGYLISTTNDEPLPTDSRWVESDLKTYKTTTVYENGTYYIFAKDKAGNVSTAEILKIDKVLKTPPTCTLTATPSDGTGSKILTITSTDKIDPVGYSWDNTEYISFNKKSVTTNGSYTAYVKDMAGNIGSCTITVSGLK